MRAPLDLRYLGALAAANLRQGFARPGEAWLAITMMIANNFVFFTIWVFYFARFRDLRGWTLADMAVLYGVAAWAVGLVNALGSGVRDIGRIILDGSLDVHLGRPRHPLPSLILSRSGPSGFGDMASSLGLWLWLGDRSVTELPLLVAMASAGAVIIAATLAIAHSLVFWWPRTARLAEEVFNATIMMAVYPQHVYGFAVRVILFTLLPVGFIALIPVEAVREADPLRALIVFAAAAFYAGLAVAIFDRGLRRYRSGNLITENR
jgi:ABC-2 type transport system permease protein